MNIVCVCDENNRKCDSADCKEYVVKFIEISRAHDVDDAVKHIEKDTKYLRQQIKKFQSQVSKNIKKYKI